VAEAHRYTLSNMPIPNNTAKAVYSGHLPGGEHFQTGYWISGITPPGAPTASAYAEAIGADFKVSCPHVAGLLRPTAGYDKVTVYFYTGGPTAAYSGEFPLAMPGTGGASPLPDQTCLVATLRTGFTGRSRRGRMYLPCTSASLADASGLFDPSVPGDVVADLAHHFVNIRDHMTGIGTVSVVSQKLGAVFPVSDVDADLRPDVQRRRANSQTTGARVVALVA
jgi:hypothetical protein